MSYPQPRHSGNGEASAVLRRAGGPPDLRLGDVEVRYVATGATTGGELGLYRWDMGPQAGGPSLHFHRGMSESFVVLDGAVELHDGRGWATAGPGDFLHVAPGGLHAFRGTGAPASMLILFTPGAPRERYFEALAAMLEGAPRPEGEAWTAFLAEHDQYEP